MDHRDLARRVRRQAQVTHATQRLAMPCGQFASALVVGVERGQLDAEDSSLQGVEPVGVPDLKVFVLGGSAVVAQSAYAGGEVVVIGRHSTRIAERAQV